MIDKFYQNFRRMENEIVFFKGEGYTLYKEDYGIVNALFPVSHRLTEELYAKAIRKLIFKHKKKVLVYEENTFRKMYEASLDNLEPVSSMVFSTGKLCSILEQNERIGVACIDCDSLTLAVGDFPNSLRDEIVSSLNVRVVSDMNKSTTNQEALSLITSLVEQHGIDPRECPLAISASQQLAVDVRYSVEALSIKGNARVSKRSSKNLDVFVPNGLYAVLNRCQTVQGSRLLRKRLEAPLASTPKIEERLNSLELFMCIDVSLYKRILKSVPDVSRLLTMRSSAENVYNLARTVQVAERLLEVSQYKKHELEEVLSALLPIWKEIEQKIECTVIGCTLRIPELEEVRNEIAFVEMDVQKEYERLCSLGSSSAKTKSTLRLEFSETQGHYFRSTDRGYKLPQDCIEIATLKNGVHFKSKKLIVLNESLLALKERSTKEQKKHVDALYERLREKAADYRRLNEVVSEIDYYCSLAEFTLEKECVRPVFGSTTILESVKHPLVDSCTGNDFVEKPNTPLVVLTGANMGGKSTYLKSVLLASLMAQCGMYVCADKAQLKVFDRIEARVGASDYASKSQSTFMVEMLELRDVLTCTDSSLVAVDELGRGTATEEGLAIAVAAAKRLRDIGCLTIFSTHFLELADFFRENAVFLKLTHFFSSGVLLFPHKVEEGVAESSMGLECAEFCGLPPHVIDMARRKKAEYEGLYSS